MVCYVPRTKSKRAATRWEYVELMGGADRSAPTEAKASRQGRRGAGFSYPIVPPWRPVSNEFEKKEWPRGDSNSHVLSNIGS
jgi:hypothetical protein